MLKKLQKKLNEYNPQYHVLNLTLSIIWIILMLLDFASVININENPFRILDYLIWLLFTCLLYTSDAADD